MYLGKEFRQSYILIMKLQYLFLSFINGNSDNWLHLFYSPCVKHNLRVGEKYGPIPKNRSSTFAWVQMTNNSRL